MKVTGCVHHDTKTWQEKPTEESENDTDDITR